MAFDILMEKEGLEKKAKVQYVFHSDVQVFFMIISMMCTIKKKLIEHLRENLDLIYPRK